MTLTPSQLAALNHIENFARTTPTVGLIELENVLTMSNISLEDFDSAVQQVKEFARVGLQFHPDRVARNGKPVVQALFEEPYYKNQFETNLSNGRLDPVAEGERAHWEDNMFGGVFSQGSASLSERPKYGALDLMLFPDGPCPRYGSCYFILHPAVSKRCTFSYMDSHREPIERGTLDVFDPIIAGLMTECFERRFALGRQDISPTELVNHLRSCLSVPFEDPSGRPAGRNLNHYIEAQIHGDISLEDDVDILVADPSFRGSQVEEYFKRVCESCGIQLYWHSGYRLATDVVPDDFRGPAMPSLAKRISTGDHIDAFAIGKAAADLKERPSEWADRGSYEVVLQELKCLWHVLVQFGDAI